MHHTEIILRILLQVFMAPSEVPSSNQSLKFLTFSVIWTPPSSVPLSVHSSAQLSLDLHTGYALTCIYSWEFWVLFCSDWFSGEPVLLFLIFIYLYGCIRSQMQHENCQLWHVGIQFPDQGLNPGPLCWEYRVLVSGPPGKSHELFPFPSSHPHLHNSGKEKIKIIIKIRIFS